MKLSAMLFVLAFAAAGALCGADGAYNENLAGYAEAGRALDLAYAAAGRQLDEANYDLAEASAQGRTIPPELLAAGRRLDGELRKNFLKLDEQRAAIRDGLRLRRAPENYLIMVENTEDSAAPDSEWIGFKSFTFKWADGTVFSVPLSSFSVGVYRKNYAPFPTGEMLFVYGRRTSHRMAVTEWFPPEPPSGPAELTVEGVDCDKGGHVAIRLYVYGNMVFSGANPFKSDEIGKLTVSLPPELLKPRPASDENLPLMRLIAQFSAAINDFKREADAASAGFLAAAAPYRKDLQYRTRTTVQDITGGKTFVRAIDVTDISWSHSRLVHPGYNYAYPHLPKHLAAAGANLVSLIIKREIGGESAKLQRTGEFAANTVIPFTVWADGAPFQDGDIISYQYYGHPDRMTADADVFLKPYTMMPHFAGLQVDEPAIRDNHHQFGKLLDRPDFIAAYRDFAARRNIELAARGLPALPDTPFAGHPSTPDEWVAYMEYQNFKANYAPESLKDFYDSMRTKSLLPSIVIQNTVPLDTPACSYTAYGKNFDYIGTDLYNNGSLQEGVALQLLKNSCALNSTVIMWPGTGYACKSPRSFVRSLLNGLAWGDGLQLWTLMYCDKYRDANSFWQHGGKALSLDDQGGDLADNWRPEYWDLLNGVFGLVADHEASLLRRVSAAPVALVLSERSLIAGLPEHANQNDYFSFVRLYAALAGQGVPVDAVFAEKLPSLERPPYHTMILYRAFALNDAEMAAVINFVRSGGRLVLCGVNGINNEWDLPRSAALEQQLAEIPASQVSMLRDEQLAQMTKNYRDSGLPGDITPEYRRKLAELTKEAAATMPLSLVPPDGAIVSVRRNADGAYIYFVLDYRSNFTERDLKCEITANRDIAFSAIDRLSSGGREFEAGMLKQGESRVIDYSGDLMLKVIRQ
ncbi:MAG: hypothetical protein PHI85_03420 [Victivallaceae bacterium]|nr:hypothetical protein [Victivallaceae bacterium]